MTTEQNNLSNPYIGPRAFKSTDTLYGRERDLAELLDLFIADRIVLLHSPSGAGKTSIIQAALIPALEKEGFNVLNIARVVHPAARQHSPEQNRYVLSTLLCLEEKLSEDNQLPDEQLPAERLEGFSLNDYLTELLKIQDEGVAIVLIFDQFEEILTLDPIDEDKKIDFFEQLGEALSNRRIWALFSMREDYVAALASYKSYLPTQLDNAYRLDLLGIESALSAIRSPVEKRGAEFDENAAKLLVDDLRRVYVQRRGKTVKAKGLYIEPVQLQVVCHQLWAKLAEQWKKQPTAKPRIVANDIEEGATVDRALADYYAGKLKEIVGDSGDEVQEREIRDWFENNLFSERGVRGQVLEGEGKSQGLDNTIIRKLIDAYLVREEIRRSFTWYELAHDRLIEPIRQNNAAWREDNLKPFQIQALIWHQQGEPDSFLLSEANIAEMEAWAVQNKLTFIEKRFLDESAEARNKIAQDLRELRFRRRERIIKARWKKKQKRSRQTRIIAFGTTLISIIAVVSLFLALVKWQDERRGNRISTSRQISADAVYNLSSNPERSMLLSMLAIAETYSDKGDKPAEEATDALSLSLNDSQVRYTLTGYSGDVLGLSFTPDGNHLATIGEDKAIIWDAVAGYKEKEISRASNNSRFSAIAYRPGKKVLAIAVENETDRKIEFWDINTWQELPELTTLHEKKINSIAFSPDGKLLATASDDGTAKVFEVDSKKELLTFKGHTQPVNSITFSPDGKFLVTASDDGTAKEWDTSTGKVKTSFPGPEDSIKVPHGIVSDAAFSPDGTRIAVGFGDGSIYLWESQSGGKYVWRRQHYHASRVWALAFNPIPQKGAFLATASEDRTINVLDNVLDPETIQKFSTLLGHAGGVRKVIFSPNGEYIASGSEDGTVKIWNIGGDQSSIEDVAFSADGRHLASIGRSGTVKVRDTDSLQNQVTFSIPKQKSVKPPPVSDGAYTEPFTKIVYDPVSLSNVTVVNPEMATPWIVKVKRPTPFQLRHTGMTCIAYFNPDKIGRWAKYMMRLVSHPDSTNDLVIAATGNETGEVRVWDPNTLKEVFPAAHPHEQKINSIAFSPDGQLLATASDDGSAKLINYKTGETTRTLTHGNKVLTLAFSLDGKLLATGGIDKQVKIWDVNSGNPVREPLTGHADQVNAVAFIPYPKNRYVLASGSGDGTVKLWDLNRRLNIHLDKSFDNTDSDAQIERTFLEAESGGVRALAVSAVPDKNKSGDGAGNRRIRLATVSGGPNETMRIHFLGEDISDLLAQMRRRATRAWLDWLEGDNCPRNLVDKCTMARGVLELIIEGNEQARVGHVNEAIAKYQEANKKDYRSLLIDDPTLEAMNLAEEGYQERGQHYARVGDWVAAVDEYRKLNDWNHLFEAGQDLIRASVEAKTAPPDVDLIDRAIGLYEIGRKAYDQKSPDESDRVTLSGYYNYLCWYGSWEGYYRKDVMRACEDAVQLSSGDPAFLDSRGASRALAYTCTKDEEFRLKAVEDFKNYMDSLGEGVQSKEVRKGWIDHLNRKESLFSRDILENSISPKLSDEQFNRIQNRIKQNCAQSAP